MGFFFCFSFDHTYDLNMLNTSPPCMKTQTHHTSQCTPHHHHTHIPSTHFTHAPIRASPLHTHKRTNTSHRPYYTRIPLFLPSHTHMRMLLPHCTHRLLHRSLLLFIISFFFVSAVDVTLFPFAS